MKTDLQIGDRVRVRGAQPVGTVERIDGDYVSVRYEHRPGTFTAGYYPATHLEKVGEAPEGTKKKAVVFSFEETKPRASTKDVLPSAL